jgi:hypothetical protein
VTEDTYTKLITLLDERGARYRLIDHPPEGRTEIASRMRGSDLRHAAKCIFLMVKMGRKTTKHVAVERKLQTGATSDFEQDVTSHILVSRPLTKDRKFDKK